MLLLERLPKQLSHGALRPRRSHVGLRLRIPTALLGFGRRIGGACKFRHRLTMLAVRIENRRWAAIEEAAVLLDHVGKRDRRGDVGARRLIAE
jgi:hypothetical protein